MSLAKKKDETTATDSARALLLYDDDCNFCRWSLTWVLRWDHHRRITPVPLQDPAADRLLAAVDPRSRMDSWHLVVGSRVWSGGAAVAPLLALLPGGRAVARLARAFPGVVERLYRLVARNRDRLGRALRLGRASCRIDRARGDGRAGVDRDQ